MIKTTLAALAIAGVFASAGASERDGCKPSDFTVKDVHWRQKYDHLWFTGTVTNNGAFSCGVELQGSSYDVGGAVVETTDFWPASIQNIEPGESRNFRMFLQYDEAGTKVRVVPINAKAR